MRYRVDWTFAAVSDLEHIRRYINQFNPRAAASVAEKIIEAADSLTLLPGRGRSVPGTNLRENTLPYPYILRYRIDGDRVVILRVRHGRQSTTP